MTRRFFLHVGSPKTGTTYLQSVLWRSAGELRRQGLVLPLRLRDHFELTLLARDQVDPETDGRAVPEVADRLRDAIAGTDADVLISHELLAAATDTGIALVRGLAEGAEVHVLLTARDWQRQLPAEWQQMTKTRTQRSFADFLEAVRLDHSGSAWQGQDYATIAARWGRDLPPEHIHVVTVPPPGAPPDLLLARFCSVLGVDPRTLDTDAPRENTSLPFEGAELMRRLNLSLGDRLPKPRAGYARVAKFWFAEQILARYPGTRLRLPAEHQAWCQESSQAQVAALAEAGYDVVGDLGDLLSRPGPPDAELPTVEDSELLERALDGLGDALVQRLEDLRTIDGLRADLRAARRRQAEPAARRAASPAEADGLLGRVRGVAGRGRRVIAAYLR